MEKEQDFDAEGWALDLERWTKKFESLLKGERLALQSWNRLRDGGVEVDSLPGYLYLSCDFEGSPGYEALALFIGKSRETAQTATRLATRLESDQKAVIEFYGNDSFLAQGSKLTREAIGKLDIVIFDLRKSAAEAISFSSKRSWNPSFFLAWTITEINEKLKRPCYREVANLLDVAYMAHGRESRIAGEDAVRKLYRRFLLKHPDAFFLDPDKMKTYVFGFVIALLITWMMEQVKSAPATGQIPTSK